MTNPFGSGADDHRSATDALTKHLEWLASRPDPAIPEGPVGVLVNRMLVYARPSQVPTVLPVMNVKRGGLVLAGAKVTNRMHLLEKVDYDGVVLVDPAAYEKEPATPEAPFKLPEGQLFGGTLGDVLDQQLLSGAAAGLTPTRFIGAGDTESLKAAAREVKKLRRNDIVFVVALDVSLLDRKYIAQTTAILADVGCSIGLVLGRQFDPLSQSSRIIPNLRELVARVPVLALRTDFNAFDLVAHGALAGAIGTAGGTRHTVVPAEKSKVFNFNDRSPSVLFPDLACWWRGSKIAELYGARPRQARRCICAVCEGETLNRFVGKQHESAAIGHGVAVWSEMAEQMLSAATLRGRAEYWRNVCAGSVAEHVMLSARLKLVKPLKPQFSVEQWATLPAWPLS